MAQSQNLDFDGTPPDASPKPAPAKPAPAKPAKPAKAAKPLEVICQRCNVPCQPIPQSRGWVRCPKCGWKHKTFTKLAAAKQAARAKQDRTAR